MVWVSTTVILSPEDTFSIYQGYSGQLYRSGIEIRLPSVARKDVPDEILE
jgi:hypothetical protein